MKKKTPAPAFLAPPAPAPGMRTSAPTTPTAAPNQEPLGSGFLSSRLLTLNIGVSENPTMSGARLGFPIFGNSHIIYPSNLLFT